MARIESGWRSADLDERRLAMLNYAVKLTRNSGAVVEDDVVSLRNVGLSDRDILDLCEVVAYYAYVNRIADGLGVTLEEWFDRG